ncbi:MAG: AIR synthase family protein [Thermaerobacter sp.]|nr:AIR synthase family protein [Thermaerobacter sp.]
MPELPAVGKISPEVFSSLIYPRLGAARPEVLVGPRSGVDIAVVEIGKDRVMATTCDPVFVVPQYGMRRAAWFAIHILASDVATSGLPPAYIAIDLNLPLEITGPELTELWDAMHETCSELGIAVISGHTARYEGCAYPMVGGATVVAVGAKDAYVTPEMARPGDVLLATKGAAIEATGLFGVTFPDQLARRIGADLSLKAQELFYQMSVVKDAMAASAYGVRERGVTAMHDATECGVLGGVFEIAQASGVGVRLEERKVLVREEVRAVCDAVGIDPLAAISEGTLLLTARPEHADGILRALSEAGVPASAIGEILPEERGMILTTDAGDRPLVHPGVDPFWAAFGKAMEAGL